MKTVAQQLGTHVSDPPRTVHTMPGRTRLQAKTQQAGQDSSVRARANIAKLKSNLDPRARNQCAALGPRGIQCAILALVEAAAGPKLIFDFTRNVLSLTPLEAIYYLEVEADTYTGIQASSYCEV